MTDQEKVEVMKNVAEKMTSTTGRDTLLALPQEKLVALYNALQVKGVENE